MAIFGSDFRGGLARPLYNPVNPAGLGWSIAIFIALIVINQLLQAAFGFGLHMAGSTDIANQRLLLRSFMIGLLPAGLVTAALAWAFAYVRSGRPASVLSLRPPALGAGGWIAVLVGFLFAIYVIILVA